MCFRMLFVHTEGAHVKLFPMFPSSSTSSFHAVRVVVVPSSVPSLSCASSSSGGELQVQLQAAGVLLANSLWMRTGMQHILRGQSLLLKTWIRKVTMFVSATFVMANVKELLSTGQASAGIQLYHLNLYFAYLCLLILGLLLCGGCGFFCQICIADNCAAREMICKLVRTRNDSFPWSASLPVWHATRGAPGHTTSNKNDTGPKLQDYSTLALQLLTPLESILEKKKA